MCKTITHCWKWLKDDIIPLILIFIPTFCVCTFLFNYYLKVNSYHRIIRVTFQYIKPGRFLYSYLLDWCSRILCKSSPLIVSSSVYFTFVGVWNILCSSMACDNYCITYITFFSIIYTFIKFLQLIVTSLICYVQLLVIRIIEIIINLCASVI